MFFIPAHEKKIIHKRNKEKMDLAQENLLNLKFHHFGMAVKHPDQVRQYLKLLGYTSLSPQINKFNVYVQFHEHSIMPRIELVYKFKDATPIDDILKNNDSQIYHTCYECEDINKALNQLKNKGLKFLCISKRSDDFPFAFYYIKRIGLIELYERP